MIGGRRPLQGRKVGDRRVRVERPHSPYFRYTGPGMLTAKAAASRARRPPGGRGGRLRRFLFGRRLSNEEEAFERLPKKLALPIFSSDAISSSAYATEEILRVLVLAGAGALLVSLEVAIAITVLLTVVSISYRQVCRAYPSGGGAYVVAKENLGQVFGLIAAAALLIDYVMTVAVSTASAVAQVYSVVPALYDLRIEIAIASIALITIANLRGPARGRAHLREPDLHLRRAGPPDDRGRRRPGGHRPGPASARPAGRTWCRCRRTRPSASSSSCGRSRAARWP